MILVDVYVPAVSQSFDFMADEHAPIKSIVFEMANMVAKKIRSGRPEETERFLLLQMEQMSGLDQELTLAECGVTDGTRLMLV